MHAVSDVPKAAESKSLWDHPGVVTGLGLLTKATFLAFVPPLLALIAVVGWRERQAWQATLIRGNAFPWNRARIGKL